MLNNEILGSKWTRLSAKLTKGEAMPLTSRHSQNCTKDSVIVAQKMSVESLTSDQVNNHMGVLAMNTEKKYFYFLSNQKTLYVGLSKQSTITHRTKC